MESGGIWAVALLMALENIFPPLPSELIMPQAGFLAAAGYLAFWPVVIAGATGATIGVVPFYSAGFYIPRARLRNWIEHHGMWIGLDPDDLDRGLAWFSRHQSGLVFYGRMIPMVRSLISIPAGLHHMPFGKFLVLTFLGSLGWSLLLTGGGFLLGNTYGQLGDVIGVISNGVLVILAVLFIGRIIYRYRKHRPNFSHPDRI